MDGGSCLLVMDETNISYDQVDVLTNKLKQALVDSTNTHRRRRRRKSNVRRCKEFTKQHQTKMNGQPSQDEQFRSQQRAMYNARQTLFIPLITNIDFSPLLESSDQQNDLLTDILNLLNNSNEQCSFFEQFSI